MHYQSYCDTILSRVKPFFQLPTARPRAVILEDKYGLGLLFVVWTKPPHAAMSTTDDARPNFSRRRRPSRVSPKGQVTIPKSVRDLLGIKPGSVVEFDVTPAGDVVLRKRPDSARALRGMFQAYARDPAPTIEEMRNAARAHVASRHAPNNDLSGPEPDEDDE